ncbi:hypothetical protein NEAUS06_0029 [Nematocida ausubeli]|nr:hypothetical protein NEAUS06_0029 [Nematocida ausubeli]
MEVELLQACREAHLDESSILLAEHIFRKEQTPRAFLGLLTVLAETNKYEAVKWLVHRRREYFLYEEIQRIYIEVMKRLGEISEIDAFMMSSKRIDENECMQDTETGSGNCAYTVDCQKTEGYSSVASADYAGRGYRPISRLSLNSYYQALIQKGSEEKRRECIDRAIEFDERNLEPYIYIGMTKSYSELEEYIDRVQDASVRELFRTLLSSRKESFSLFSRSFHTPFSCCRIAKRLFNERQTSEIFQIAQYTASVYPSHYFTYIISGMYYILIGKHADGKRALFKALQLNNSYGMGWILLGYCQAFLCESSNAIACYEKAEVLMESTGYMPSLGIALEYHRMRSYQKAEKKYLDVQKKYGMEYCFNPYVSLLVVQGRYDEALQLIADKTCSGERALLKSVCYLFLDETEMAEEALQDVNISYHSKTQSKYYLLLGYIQHMKKKYCEAIELYQKAILDPSKPAGSLVNDLLELAIKNSLEENNKKLVMQYKEDVFDFLDLKADLPLVL